METVIILDLVCRCLTNKCLPNNCIQLIVHKAKQKEKKKRKNKKKENVELYAEYNERGARIKRLKSKVRIKRAFRHS